MLVSFETEINRANLCWKLFWFGWFCFCCFVFFLNAHKEHIYYESLTFPVAYCVLELYGRNFAFVCYSCVKNKITLCILTMNFLKDLSQSGAWISYSGHINMLSHLWKYIVDNIYKLHYNEKSLSCVIWVLSHVTEQLQKLTEELSCGT